MSQRLKNIYTHVVHNRKGHRKGWYEEYKSFVNDVREIKKALQSGLNIRDSNTFIHTSLSNNPTPFDAFISKFIYDFANGIASRGRSVISGENLNKLKSNSSFDKIISDIITSPSKENYDALQQWWEDQKIGNNPLLINRMLGACTLDVSTTADNGKFNQIFYWLQNEGLIKKYPDEEPQDWFSKNIFLVEQMRLELSGFPEIDNFWINISIWEMYVYISNPFSLKKQIIKYGAPGTGKTFSAIQNTQFYFAIWKDEFASENEITHSDCIDKVQFHSSFTYEDFIEGMRPDSEGDKVRLKIQNGIFKNFCIKAAKW
ncbi:MAG: restriction endonuclease, partial [Bacteroidetes bacterium]|nr:restriction endonuclease [Bacteroidota bacterium]